MNEEQIAQLVQLLVQAGAALDENQAMQIIQMASQGDLQAQLVVQLVVQLAQGGTPSAKLGAKLNYLKKLKKVCNEDLELAFFKVGGKVCKACVGKKMKMGAKVAKDAQGGMLANKGTAFGDGKRGANPRNTDRGGHRSHGNTRAASYMKKTNVPNKFTAFGDTGRKKPTNVGLVGHRATGQVGRLQSKYTTSDNVNKHTAFGAHINRSHRGSAACPATKGWKSMKGAPKGHGGQMGWKKYANGGTLTEAFVNYFLPGGVFVRKFSGETYKKYPTRQAVGTSKPQSTANPTATKPLNKKTIKTSTPSGEHRIVNNGLSSEKIKNYKNLMKR